MTFRKAIKILAFSFLSFVVFFVIVLINALTGNRIWGSFDCGGIDPYFNPGCYDIGAGNRRTCFVFICSYTKSEISHSIPNL